MPGIGFVFVRSSGRAPGLFQRGPIYEEASHHPEIEEFLT